MQGEAEFLKAATSLKHAAPREWEAFLASLGAYRDGVLHQCLTASRDELPEQRAKALTVHSLLAQFSKLK